MATSVSLEATIAHRESYMGRSPTVSAVGSCTRRDGNAGGRDVVDAAVRGRRRRQTSRRPLRQLPLAFVGS